MTRAPSGPKPAPVRYLPLFVILFFAWLAFALLMVWWKGNERVVLLTGAGLLAMTFAILRVTGVIAGEQVRRLTSWLLRRK